MKQSNEIYTYTYIFELKLKILNNIRCWLFNVQNLMERKQFYNSPGLFKLNLKVYLKNIKCKLFKDKSINEE